VNEAEIWGCDPGRTPLFLSNSEPCEFKFNGDAAFFDALRSEHSRAEIGGIQDEADTKNAFDRARCLNCRSVLDFYNALKAALGSPEQHGSRVDA